MACPNCGSWAVRADRSLAGRMVCARCGQGLGVGAGKRRGRRFAWRQPWPQVPRQWRGWLSLGLLLAVSALLAAQVPNERRPPPGPGSPLTRGPGVVPIR